MPAKAISFRLVTEADAPLLRKWLEQPHWRAWWGPVEEELAMILQGKRTGELVPCIAGFSTGPVAYIQSWPVDHYHDDADWLAQEPWLADVAKGTIGVDVSIGDAGNLGKGYGPEILNAFAARLFDEGAPRLIIDPDVTNARAIRAYEKAGFRAYATVGHKHDTLLMELTKEMFEENT